MLPTRFTEGDSQDRSTNGGGMENSIRELKSLLGQLARDYNVQVCSRRMYGDTNEMNYCSSLFNKSSEAHNVPPETLLIKCLFPKAPNNSTSNSKVALEREQNALNCKIF